MKTLYVILAVGTLASPVVGFSQSTAPLTRDEVRADLVRVEQAGYSVGDGDAATYPAQIQAAEAKVSREESNNGIGGTPGGTSAAGSHLKLPNPSSSSCVGPESYCNVFFGN